MNQIKGELFGQPFIPKLLDGTKIRTSRPVKPQPELTKLSGRWVWPIPKSKIHKGCCTEVCSASSSWWQYLMPDQFPYQPGDIMYVRETFAKGRIDYGEEPDGRAVPYISQCESDLKNPDFIPKEYALRNDVGIDDVIWTPSIHMPSEAARIFLRVTDVKAQRLDDLTEQDAVEDGFTFEASGKIENSRSALDKFKSFWISQYGLDAQWMWVYYLKLISKEEAYEH